MGHLLPSYLVLGSGITAGVAYYKLTRNTMRPLSTDAQLAITAVAPRTSAWGEQVTLRTPDLIRMGINSRVLVREADRLRHTGPQNDELDQAHADVAWRSKRIPRQIAGALLERVAVKYFGFESLLYSTSAAWHYSQQILALDNIEESAGIPLAGILEARI